MRYALYYLQSSTRRHAALFDTELMLQATESSTASFALSTNPGIHPAPAAQTPRNSETESGAAVYTQPERCAHNEALLPSLASYDISPIRSFLPRLPRLPHKSRRPNPQPLICTFVQRLETPYNKCTIRYLTITRLTQARRGVETEDAVTERGSKR